MRRLAAFGRLAQAATLLVAAASAICFIAGATRWAAALAVVAVAGALVAVLELQVRLARAGRAGADAATRRELKAIKAGQARQGQRLTTLGKRIAAAREGVDAVHTKLDWLTGLWAAREETERD